MHKSLKVDLEEAIQSTNLGTHSLRKHRCRLARVNRWRMNSRFLRCFKILLQRGRYYACDGPGQITPELSVHVERKAIGANCFSLRCCAIIAKHIRKATVE